MSAIDRAHNRAHEVMMGDEANGFTLFEADLYLLLDHRSGLWEASIAGQVIHLPEPELL